MLCWLGGLFGGGFRIDAVHWHGRMLWIKEYRAANHVLVVWRCAQLVVSPVNGAVCEAAWLLRWFSVLCAGPTRSQQIPTSLSYLYPCFDVISE